MIIDWYAIDNLLQIYDRIRSIFSNLDSSIFLKEIKQQGGYISLVSNHVSESKLRLMDSIPLG
jgi:hypothetical protein